jgi:hypothetical protein
MKNVTLTIQFCDISQSFVFAITLLNKRLVLVFTMSTEKKIIY